MQKRGAMVDAEDFVSVTKTYPTHPDSSIVPNHKTNTELKEYRAKMEALDIKSKKDAIDAKTKHLQNVQFKDYYIPQDFVEKPKYNAIWEKKEDELKMWRQKNGLNATNIDTNPEKLPDPSLKWVDKPDYNLKERR